MEGVHKLLSLLKSNPRLSGDFKQRRLRNYCYILVLKEVLRVYHAWTRDYSNKASIKHMLERASDGFPYLKELKAEEPVLVDFEQGSEMIAACSDSETICTDIFRHIESSAKIVSNKETEVFVKETLCKAVADMVG